MSDNIKDKKILYTMLLVLMVSILSLSVAYAALATTLKIMGTAQITSSDWNIYFSNPVVRSGSASTEVPTIVSATKVSFNAELSLPGDFYEFTVDVVNDGSIDAMIESIEKTPELTTEQAKYLKYEVSYKTGESIQLNQALKSKTSIPIKVRIEYRKDISSSELPTTKTELSLSITLNYVQSTNESVNVPNNGVSTINIVSGDINTVGSEICISDECFYVIGNDGTNVSMLAKYNLLVGNQYNVTDDIVTPLANPTGKQDPTAIGYFRGNSADNPLIGTIPFSESPYWGEDKYPANIYSSDSNLYQYVENYKVYLNNLGSSIENARLITYDELKKLGCVLEGNMCGNAPSWVYSTTYWTQTAGDDEKVWNVISNGYAYADLYDCNRRGVRPVIEIYVNDF